MGIIYYNLSKNATAIFQKKIAALEKQAGCGKWEK
jgi:hypothetical protein